MTDANIATIGELIKRKRALDSSRHQLEKAQKEYETCYQLYKFARVNVLKTYMAWDPPPVIRESSEDPERAVSLMCLRRILRRKISHLRYLRLLTAMLGLPNELFEDVLAWLDNGVMCCHLMCEIGYDSRYDWQRVMCFLAGKRYVEPKECSCYRRVKRCI